MCLSLSTFSSSLRVTGTRQLSTQRSTHSLEGGKEGRREREGGREGEREREEGSEGGRVGGREREGGREGGREGERGRKEVREGGREGGRIVSSVQKSPAKPSSPSPLPNKVTFHTNAFSPPSPLARHVPVLVDVLVVGVENLVGHPAHPLGG